MQSLQALSLVLYSLTSINQHLECLIQYKIAECHLNVSSVNVEARQLDRLVHWWIRIQCCGIDAKLFNENLVITYGQLINVIELS